MKIIIKPLLVLSVCAVLLPLYTNCSGFTAATNGSSSSSSSSNDGSASQPKTGWSVLKVGAGGYLSGLDVSNDGSTKVVRTDTYGAYIWNETEKQWHQLMTSHSMPLEFQKAGYGGPVSELRVAPNLATRLYMTTLGFVFRSNDRGTTWTKLPLSFPSLGAADDYKTWGQKMAVDPTNPDVVYLGTPDNGIYRTADGGATWNKIAEIPNAGVKAGQTYSGGYTGIAFDPTSGSVSGKTKVIYVPGYGNGVYRSADGGATWVALNGGPTTVKHARVAVDGSYYAASDADGHMWRYRSGAWQDLTPNENRVYSVAVHPQDPQTLVAVSDGGSLNISRNGGVTWTGWLSNIRVAMDIPWLAWTNENYMSAGDITFDPSNPNRLWFAQGVGAWTYDLEAISGTTTWTSHNTGIEQLVTNTIVAPPGGKPLVGSWDRPVFRIDNPDVYPTTHGPDRVDAIQMAWSLDYASSNPNFVVGLMNWGKDASGYSADGGKTWSKFATYPPLFSTGKLGGSIAASTPTNFVWVPNNNGRPYYTLDGGATWIAANIPNAPTGSESGYGWAYYFRRVSVVADRVLPNTFYLYNYVSGVYRTTDGGVNWTQVYNQPVGAWSSYHAKMRIVPGKAGNLFFSSGSQGGAADNHPADIKFYRSSDGGSSWTAVPNVAEVLAFGFGKAALGQTYPTIFISGWVNNVYGIYRSTDNAASWEKLGEAFPGGSLDGVATVEGDMDIYGRVYVGLGGSGSVYGQFP